MPLYSPLATLHSVLQTVCASAETNAPLLRKNEAATRAALIDPVLRALGWDTANVQMVEPERTIGSELRVDYLLHDAAGNPRLVVEAKCLGASLDKHGYVSKVLGYALGFKVQTVFITDGMQWHCYSNLHKGNTEAVTFSLTDDVLAAALHLIQWLDAAQSGHGISATSSEKPEPSTVTIDSSDKLEKSITEPAASYSVTEDFIDLAQINQLQLEPNQKPKHIRFPDGTIRAINTWKDVLVESCRFVLEHNSNVPIPYPDKGGKLSFLIREAKPVGLSSTPCLYHGKTVFIFTHYRATNCIANALHILKLVPSTLQKTSAAVAF